LAYGKLEEAERVAKRGLESDPVGYPKLYELLAGIYEKNRDHVRRDETLRQGVQKTWDAKLVLLLARIHAQNNRKDEALDLLRKGRAKHPDDPRLADAIASLS